jgi:prolyl-tRNA editing enzyme YbaK/EbsC (Cys-tRNA(Pro) deacylase)
LSAGLQRVRGFFKSSNLDVKVVELRESTKSSALAAAALRCSAAEIAKSVVFIGRSTVVVVISGDKRVDVKKLSRVMTEELRVATPDEVIENTGYVVGGVPPFPHNPGVLVLLDVSTKRFGRVWAAGGDQNAIFQISVVDLARTIGTREIDVAS